MQIRLMLGDCLERMKDLEDNSVDSIVTDPPYGISFMAKKWDYDVPSVEIWKECLRVLKPGGHMLVACGTRTQHRMVVNIEDAGFEIRDVITWLYGSGFPKSMDISKAIDKEAGAEREVIGVNEDYLRRKPNGMKTSGATAYNYSNSQMETNANITTPATEAAKQWEGWGTSIKPAVEFFTLCRKPISEKTVAKNVLKHGTGGLNIDGCRIETTDNLNGGRYSDNRKVSVTNTYSKSINLRSKLEYCQPDGRFPANLILDEESAALLDEQTGTETSRFFYVAKASRSERNAGLPSGVTNTHPTLKPVKLMEYLCRLITPPGGTVLDPFMGSGSTGIAAIREGFGFIGIEREEEYKEIAKARILAAKDLTKQLS